MNEFLQVGDVFELKEGMNIYAWIPEKFTWFNRKMSDTLTKTLVTIGEIRTNELDLIEQTENLKKEINKHVLLELGLEVDKTNLDEFVKTILSSYKKDTFDTNIFIGEYVVTKINENSDFFSSYMKDVYCKKLKNSIYDPHGIEVLIHQEGFSSTLILPKDITLLRKYEMMFR